MLSLSAECKIIKANLITVGGRVTDSDINAGHYVQSRHLTN